MFSVNAVSNLLYVKKKYEKNIPIDTFQSPFQIVNNITRTKTSKAVLNNTH